MMGAYHCQPPMVDDNDNDGLLLMVDGLVVLVIRAPADYYFEIFV